MSYGKNLEELDFRQLQKLAKARSIRYSGRGVTKKKLISELSRHNEEESEPKDCQLTEVPVTANNAKTPLQTILDDLTSDPNDVLEDKKAERERIRRLTFSVSSENGQGQLGATRNVRLTPESKEMKNAGVNKSLRTNSVKTPSLARVTPGAKKLQTPLDTAKTPRINRTASLRIESVKKSALQKTESKIPVRFAKKPPNFSTIHQNAFDKMDSLWDVEKRRKDVIDKNLTSSALKKKNQKATVIPEKANAKQVPLHINSTQTVASTGKSAVLDKKASARVLKNMGNGDRKEYARQVVSKTKLRSVEARRDENRTLLKGVRLNRQFTLQMKNRGLI